MSHTPPEMNSNPYQAYPNPSGGNYGAGSSTGAASGPYPSQSQYPGSAQAANKQGSQSDHYNSVGPSVVGPYSPNLSPHFNGTTAMLALLSMVTLYEATHRVIVYSRSGLPWDAVDGYFPAAALLVGAIWEALYGLLTLFIALWAVLFDWHSVAMTTLALGTQFVGWYTVVVFALAQPALEAHRLNEQATLNAQQNIDPIGFHNPVSSYGWRQGIFEEDMTRSSFVFGWLLPLFSLNTALLAGMIFFTLQLLHIQMNNTNELHSPRYYGRRLSFWSLLNMVYGLSTIIYAAMYLGKGYNRLGYADGNSDYFYPNFTSLAALTLITGIMFTILSLMGLFGCCANNLHVSNLYIAWSWFTFLWVVAAHVMGQCGVQSANYNQSGFGLAELGLFFGVLFIGKYLAYKAATIETVHRGNYVHGPYNNNNNRGHAVV